MKIFDGYNVIGAGRDFGLGLEQEDKEDRLIRLLSSYRARLRKKEAFLVVFDGDYGTLARGPKRYRQGGVTVEWAVGETADNVIVRRLAADRNPRGIEVVTSDEEVLRQVRQSRGRSVRSREFLARVQRDLGPGEESEKPRQPSPAEVDEWLTIFGGEDEGSGGGSR